MNIPTTLHTRKKISPTTEVWYIPVYELEYNPSSIYSIQADCVTIAQNQQKYPIVSCRNNPSTMQSMTSTEPIMTINRLYEGISEIYLKNCVNVSSIRLFVREYDKCVTIAEFSVLNKRSCCIPLGTLFKQRIPVAEFIVNQNCTDVKPVIHTNFITHYMSTLTKPFQLEITGISQHFSADVSLSTIIFSDSFRQLLSRYTISSFTLQKQFYFRNNYEYTSDENLIKNNIMKQSSWVYLRYGQGLMDNMTGSLEYSPYKAKL